MARAWPGWARGFAGALVAVSRAALPLVAFAFARDTTIDPRLLLGAAIGLGALPAAAARLLERAFAAEVALDAEALRVRCVDLAIEIPRASIAGVRAWRIPLPGAGVALRLASGARAPVGLEPAPDALVAAFGVAHPNLAYADARRTAPLAIARSPWVRFGLFGLVPAAVLFRAQQVIGFGGLFGQYYLEGLRAWSTTLAVTWAATLAGLVLVASALRALAECAVFALAWIAPRRSGSSRSRTTRASPRSSRSASSADRYGVAGSKTERPQPIRSCPNWFHTGFLPPTICDPLKSGAPDPEPPPNRPLEIVADP